MEAQLEYLQLLNFALDNVQSVRDAMVSGDRTTVLALLPQINSSLLELLEYLDLHPTIRTALCKGVADAMEATSTIFMGINGNESFTCHQNFIDLLDCATETLNHARQSIEQKDYMGDYFVSELGKQLLRRLALALVLCVALSSASGIQPIPNDPMNI